MAEDQKPGVLTGGDAGELAALVLLLIAAAVAGLRQMGYWGSLVGRLAGLAAALQVDD